jgi:hypothetical protein
MKPLMAIKPLVFAIAAVMAVAVQAGQRDDEHHHHNHRHHQPDPFNTTNAGATAKAWDTQSSHNNYIKNEGTKNKASMTDSATGASGNVGVNVAAGDGNQQDNAAAIASGDGKFVFGSAVASAKVTQDSHDNKVYNYSTTNSATMSGSANGGSGNMGINMAAGDLNQQKNTMAIAVSGGKYATATASADQSGPGLTVLNNADRTYRLDTLSRTKTVSGDFTFSESSKSHSDSAFTKHSETKSASQSASESASHAGVKANLDVDVDVDLSASRNQGRHHSSSSANFDADIDASLSASIDKSNSKSSKASSSKSYDASGSASRNKSQSFDETSSFELSKTVSWQVLTPTGWANPVTNTANLSGSVNGGSGNLGVNVAAGVGNQQSNSLSIAAGCRTCL